ncbi:PRC-barrel domain-containing protein [Falsiroseomonas tokyonensis]|uniref:PRC-barrel domain-containing protein n=1 Tax=Falsiroseomonas tokyonensis TaxID=430521 RepID=A0ABV7C1G9_9PROT|nr:PRC-barrel domain-containing protein [Falsiroseomonas tokyonensis]MBU8540765.1 PRC-barrel domain-containing protein [Falsiroseomonas tokyonensis]
MLNAKTFLSMSTAAAIACAPVLAFGQTAPAPTAPRTGVTSQAPDGAPGNPPSTATQRALDSVTGNRTNADGTGNNPPGTAAGRAIDRATTPDTARTTTAPATATGATTPTLSVDSMTLRESRRASQIIGSNIYNEENNSIGEVDDLIVPRAGGSPVAVISVGGFLGIGAKLVAIPYERLTHDAERNRWVLRGATKDSLQSLPAFTYDNAARRG